MVFHPRYRKVQRHRRADCGPMGAITLPHIATIAIEQCSPHRPQQSRLAGFVFSCDHIEPRLEPLNHDRFAELLEPLHLDVPETETAHESCPRRSR